MRVTGARDLIGSKGDLEAFEIIRGEQKNITVTLRDSSNDPVDITGYTVESNVEFYKSTVTFAGRGDSLVADVSNFNSYMKDDSTLTVAINDAENGQVRILIPEDLALDSDTAPADSTNDVLTPLIYIKWTSNSTPSIITISRLLLIIRHGF